VVLIDVDAAYYTKPDDYLPQSKKILGKHNLEWPNAIAPNGFNDTVRAFNLSGYNNFVVDARGIVRGVNLHGKALDDVVDKIMEEKNGESSER
jgi:hypothetical protein